MITRKASSPHICLRCRLNLASRWMPQFRRRPSSTSAPKVAEAEAIPEDLLPRDRPNGNDNVNISNRKQEPIQTKTLHISRGGDRRLGRLGRSNEFSRLPPRPPVYSRLEKKFSKLSEYPLGRAHGHGAFIRRENVENLPSSTSLGDPAKVIVLKDSIFKLYRHDQRKDMLDEKVPEHIDIQQALDDERGLAGEEEVNDNIEALKPQPGEEPTDWGHINVLVKALQDGFKTGQLQRYIRGYRGKTALEKPEPAWQNAEKGSLIQRITPWLPGISEIEHQFDDDPMRGYSLESHTPKQRLILRLLRPCWGVELPELVHGIGQFEIQVKATDLELLLTGTRSALDAIYNDDLNHDEERLEVFLLRQAIRVTTTQDRKPWIVSRVQAALSNIRRETINVAHFLPGIKREAPRFGPKYLDLVNQQFDEPSLQELGRLTQTVITRNGFHIEVSSVDLKPGSSSSKLDSVRRLLLMSVNPSHHVDHQLAFPANDAGASLVDYPPSFSKSLPWRERNFNWKRLVAPITHSTLSETPVEGSSCPTKSEIKAIEIKMPSTLNTKPAQNTKDQVTADSAKPCWKPEFFTETSALLGSVLHTYANASVKMPLNIKSEATTAFVTHVPNLSRFFSDKDMNLPKGGQRVNQLVIRFVPNPFFLPAVPTTTKKRNAIVAGPEVYKAFPPIEMRLVYDRDSTDPILKDVQAIVHESKTDVLLPQSLVDLRFHQRTTSRLQRRYLDSISQYMKSSKLRLDGSPLQAPPKITFPMTNDMVQRKAPKIINGESNLPTELQPWAVQDVEYLFAGLEIRSNVELEWRGWRLIYTSIEAGKAQGKRSELRLRPMRHGKTVTEKEFIKQAYKLVGEINGGGSDVDYVPAGARVRRLKNGRQIFRKVETPHKPGFEYFYRRIELDNRAVPYKLNDDGSRDLVLEDVKAEEEAPEYDGWTGWEDDEDELTETKEESS